MQFLSIAVFLYGVVQVSLGCTCAWYPRMPLWQSQLCSALKYNNNGFVIKAKVTGDRTKLYPDGLFSPVFYEINLEESKNQFGDNVDTSRVYTASDGGVCGISLTKGETYVLSGHINNNGELWVYLCNFFRTWSSITNNEMHLFVVNKNAQDCPDPSCLCVYEAKPNEPFWKSLICKAAAQDNGFVLVAQITADQTSEPEPGYVITLTGSQNELDADITKVYTRANGRCDVLLTVGNKYILTGTVEAGKLVVEGCSYYKLWFDASEEEKQYVNNPEQFC